MHDSLSQGQLYVTVDMLILTVRDGKLTLLLSRRKDAPYAGRWALPGRFVGLDESAETAVRKLLAEMLPVKDAFLEQLYTFSEVNRDPRGRVISTAYLVIVPRNRLDALTGGTEILFRRPEGTEKEGGLQRREEGRTEIPFRRSEVAEEADGPRWQEEGGKKIPFSEFEVTEEDGGLRLRGEDGTVLIGSDLAFDHGRIIGTGVQRLQGKIDYTDVGFRFLNDTDAFSLGELQTVFEAVLGRKLDSSNFRRFIRNRYEETGKMTVTDREDKQKRGRPAVLYRLTEKGGKRG